MITPARFLFDECFAGPVVDGLVLGLFRLFGSDADVVHLFTKFGAGAKDETWIPQLASEGGWIILTADRGKKSKKGQKLPEICRQFRVTHIMLSAKLHMRSMSTKVLAVHHCLESILDAATFQPGTGFLLQLTGADPFRIKKVTDPMPADQRGVQKDLFTK